MGHVGQWPTHFLNCVGLAHPLLALLSFVFVLLITTDHWLFLPGLAHPLSKSFCRHWFWTTCMQNYIAMRNCAFQITHRYVILRTHGPKFRHSNDHSNCAIWIKIQIAHFCSCVKTVMFSIWPWYSWFRTHLCDSKNKGVKQRFLWKVHDLKIRPNVFIDYALLDRRLETYWLDQ